MSNKVLCWKDVNGGLHCDPELYLHFFPSFKVAGAIARMTQVQEKLEEAKEAARVFLNENKGTTG